MDANKLKKLHEIGYKIKTCAICKHGTLAYSRGSYGSCSLHKFKHLKHTDKTRPLSIHAHGHCDKFEVAEDFNYICWVDDTWREFLE
jgi:hypothetical protein